MHLEDPIHALSRSPGISLVGSVRSEEPTSRTCFGPLETPGATLHLHGEQMPMIYISQTPGSQRLKNRAPSSQPGVRTHPEMQGGWGLPSGSEEAAPPGTVCFTPLLAPFLPSPLLRVFLSHLSSLRAFRGKINHPRICSLGCTL